MHTRELAETYRRLRDLPETERAAALDAACGDDFMARARIEKLLRNLRPPTRLELLGNDPLPESVGGYRVLRLIARGGMGSVYEGENEQKVRVAIKVLRGGSTGPDALKRFKREAQILQRLTHPSIARIHSAGSTADKHPYIVMGLVEGRTVTGHALGIAETGRVEILARICEAVDYAHRNGVIHRDLKPSNVLVTAEGHPMVLDFGIARCLNGDSWQTLDGTIMGTAAYMSPEQALGLDLDSRTDIYSLGVIAHEVLAETQPGGDMPDARRLAALTGPKGLPCSVPGPLGQVVARALATDRDQRYARASDFARELRISAAPLPHGATPCAAEG